MTRELKLALIVGFSLVLVVTVLISDHLSKARKSELETKLVEHPQLTPQTPAEPVFTSNTPGGAGNASNAPWPGASSLTPISNGSETASEPGVGQNVGRPSPTEPSSPVEIRQARLTESEHSGLSDAVSRLGSQIKDGNISIPPATRLDPGPGTTPPSTPGRTDPSVLSPTQPPTSITGRPAVSGGPSTPTTTPTTTGAKPDREYVVVEGDSAYKIAKQFYGKGEYWKKLAAANGDRISSSGGVHIGAHLKIPPMEVITGHAAPSPTATLTSGAAKPGAKVDPKTTAKPAGAMRTYTVKHGDTLQAIASRELKSVKRAAEIVKLNSDVIKDEDSLTVGMVLKLPAA